MEKQEMQRISLFQNQMRDDCIHGKIIFVDDFGSLVTNITRRDFDFNIGEFEIKIGNSRIEHLVRTFADGHSEEAIALFGGDFRWCSRDDSGDLLTIAVNMGNAAEIIEVKRGDPVLIRRY